MRARSFITGIIAAFTIGLAMPAQAGVINFGLDIHSDGVDWNDSTATATTFYNGSDGGDTLYFWDQTLQFTLDTAAGAWSNKTIKSFDFFVDATDVGSGEVFTLALLDGVTWHNVAILANNSWPSTQIPVITGGRTDSPFLSGDADSTFFAESDGNPYNYFDDIASGGLAFRITRTSGDARIDGVNLQVVYDDNPSTPPDVPEPTTLVLMGAALIGGAMRLRRQ